ncbi:MAG TPA: hypothetical protein VF505_15390 [Thermoanaerobaculia bacterium]
MRALLARLRFSLTLMTERRTVMFAILDALFVLAGLVIAFNSGDSAAEFYVPMFIMPALLIGVPILADAVAIERRSGTIDLAMTSPGAHTYFERRVASVAALLVVQGWLGVLVARIAGEPFPVSGPMLQIVIAAGFLCSVALNWTVRVRTTGAVVFAVYATIIAFSPWFFSNPVHPPGYRGQGPMRIPDYISYFKTNLVLALAGVIFYLYARQRLSRPETIIT